MCQQSTSSSKSAGLIGIKMERCFVDEPVHPCADAEIAVLGHEGATDEQRYYLDQSQPC